MIQAHQRDKECTSHNTTKENKLKTEGCYV